MKTWKTLITVGALILALGIFIAAINSVALDIILQSSMVISPTSQTYPMWKDLPVPLISSFYLFEVTNAANVSKQGAKPMMKERGPYVFQEFHHKFDEIWNDNGTVTYKQLKNWTHISGDLDEKVTILNVPYASMGASVLLMPPFERVMVSMGLAFLKKEELFVTKTVREILFDGYSDPLLDAGTDLAKMGIKLPGLTSKFGLFFGRNNTWYSDGITNIYTGSNGITELGRVTSFNYSKTSPAFEGRCARYNGSPDLFPPYMDGSNKQLVFNNDLGRTLELTPTGETEEVFGTKGDVYKVDKSYFANATINPENQCYGNYQMPSGMFNASACRFNAPIYMSQPHFYQADPYYNQFLAEGSMNPDKAKHETTFIFEPVSGVPLKLSARFQINVKLNKIKELSAFKNLPDLAYIPFTWFETSMEMEKPMASQLWYLSNLKMIMIATGGIFVGVGFGLFIYGYFHYMTSVRSDKNYRKVEPRTENNQDQEAEADPAINTEVTEVGGDD